MFCAAFRRFVVWSERQHSVIPFRFSKAVSKLSFLNSTPCRLGPCVSTQVGLLRSAQLISLKNMPPRGKAKAKKDVGENGKERKVRESRNVKAASYKDLSDSDEEKPSRRRKQDSESASMSEEEMPKKRTPKGRRAPARSKKDASDSEEASEFSGSDESSGDNKKRKLPARKPARSLRAQRGTSTSYKDLTDSEAEEDSASESKSSSEKEEKSPAKSNNRSGRPPKAAAKPQKEESSASGSDDKDSEPDDSTVEKKADAKTSTDIKCKDESSDKEESSAKADKKPRPEHALSEEEMSEEEEVSKEENDSKKRGRPEKSGGDSIKDKKPPAKKSSAKSDKPKPEHALSEEEMSEEEEVSKEENDSKKRGRPEKSGGDSTKDKKPPAKKAKVEDKPKLNRTDTDYDSIDFSSDSKTEGGQPWNLKISSWNVASLRTWIQKGGLDFIKYEKPDILCLQETKCSEKKLPPEAKVEGFHTYWHSGEKEGYAGVALLSKVKPLNVEYGVGKQEFDVDGRVITAEYEKFFLVNVYVPNAGQGLKTLPRRLEWDPIFRAHLKKLDEKKPVILCGDMNVSHLEIDLANPKTNTKSAGFTPQEREGMTELLKEGFVDTFRKLYPDKTGAYSFWTYLQNARSRNVGWRLDYFITSERFTANVCDNVIRSEVYGSDHCPVTLFAHLE